MTETKQVKKPSVTAQMSRASNPWMLDLIQVLRKNILQRVNVIDDRLICTIADNNSISSFKLGNKYKQKKRKNSF